MSINSVNISGNLAREPELRASASGNSVLKLGVAVNGRYFNKQTNNWEDKPCFVDCIMFGKRAESISQYLSKGSKVSICGKLSYSSWQAQDGSNRSKLEVIVDAIEFMSPRNPVQDNQAPRQMPMQPQQVNCATKPQMAPQTAPQPVQQPMMAQPQQGQSIYDYEDIPF